jgi:hypothetical protein
LDNNVTVTRTGRVVRDGRERELEEGQTVNRTGAFFDRTGNAIENAWDDTKAGVKKAADKVGDAAKKAGDKIEDAVDKDKNNRQ